MQPLAFTEIQVEQQGEVIPFPQREARAAELEGIYALNGGRLPSTRWVPRDPESILKLKICDPAMGSGSFLVAALRFLTDALYESLFYHGWLREEGDRILVSLNPEDHPSWFGECVRDLPVTVENPEMWLKARLKRYGVERCLYGVDIDPLAVELARLSLWVETMDRSLPFSFLDHKLKCGNSLVGCWFDRFQDYPVMAWEREGGDKNHERFVHHFRMKGKTKESQKPAGDKWTQAIKDVRNERVKPEMKRLIEAMDPVRRQQLRLPAPEFDLPRPPEVIHDEALQVFEDLHRLPVVEAEEQQRIYRERIEGSERIQWLKLAFDTWCAIWFWPGDELEIAPTPAQFFDPPEEIERIVKELRERYQFFHWELEFPDVFASANGGFDGVIGNPPWETLQPNSKEFFSNVDPLYRTYGKQEALEYQKHYFDKDPEIEREWLDYCAKFKAITNWYKNVAYPFGDPEEAGNPFSFSRSSDENAYLHKGWKRQRLRRKGYVDPEHYYRHQGEGKPYTYKMFLELGHIILRNGGQLGIIIPSGIYTDKGTTNLRRLFIEESKWIWLFGFENRDRIFKIDSRFKFCPVIIQKGGETESIKVAFMERDLTAWEEAEEHVLDYPREQVEEFSPYTRALLETRSERDLEILKKMYANGVLLGDDGPQGWGIQYRQGDFNMTSDSKLFPPRPQWEAKGYQPDEYGHWIKGNWQPYDGPASILKRPEGLILSRDGSQGIRIGEVEDLALPLYQGVMIHQFDFSRKGWISGTGLRAIWREIGWAEKQFDPQFLIGVDNYHSDKNTIRGLKVAFRDIARSTDERTFISSLLPDLPCGNKVPVFGLDDGWFNSIVLCGVLNSFCIDYVLRTRIGSTSLNYYILEDLPLLIKTKIPGVLSVITSSLGCAHIAFSKEWLSIAKYVKTQRSWQGIWSVTDHERLRKRVILDAVIAELYRLETSDLEWILGGCDHPTKQVGDSTFSRTLDPKGFWRAEKDKDPELRHTVLSQIAFHDLKQMGLEAFLTLNDGEGWMIPETLRLADYDLGHDDRAKEPQPVASRLGPRFLPWQLEGSVEDSW